MKNFALFLSVLFIHLFLANGGARRTIHTLAGEPHRRLRHRSCGSTFADGSNALELPTLVRV